MGVGWPPLRLLAVSSGEQQCLVTVVGTGADVGAWSGGAFRAELGRAGGRGRGRFVGRVGDSGYGWAVGVGVGVRGRGEG